MEMGGVRVDVEYCGSCGHKKQFIEMAQLIKKAVPQVEIAGIAGRQGSYEIKINDELVYSKLQTMAFPEFSEVSEIVKEVYEGKPLRTIDKQQPINCILM